jgi:glucose/arabinose dehydrogenase
MGSVRVSSISTDMLLDSLTHMYMTMIKAVLWLFGLCVTIAYVAALRAEVSPILTGRSAFGCFRADAPGIRREITAADLPPPFSTDSATNSPTIVAQPDGATLRVPSGFVVQRFASGLDNPRLVRLAPNGDVFIAESAPGRIRVMRVADGASHPERTEIFATGLTAPFGIGFWPPGPNPQFLYIANTGSVVRFPYRNGDLKARGRAETVVADLPAGGHLRGGGHWTRDLVFSKQGSRMFVSVGSESNDALSLLQTRFPGFSLFAERYGFGAITSWLVPSSLIGSEEHRADVLQYNPDGTGFRIFATGLRNCVGMAVNPTTGDLWCSTNERDGLGDNVPPDYITRVRDGGFYGWPWYYIGANEDPFHEGERPDLRNKVIVPDVLIEAHSASLQMTFYDGQQFPPEYRGNVFAAEHGSWNRSCLTGYKVIRAIVRDGNPTGEYDDFLTGFVTKDGKVWGRPVGVAVMHDGSLIVTEDAHGTVWRISYEGQRDS